MAITQEEILEKGVKKSQTEAEKTAKLAGIEEQVKLAQEQVATIQAGVSALVEIDTAGAPAIDAGDRAIIAGGVGAVTGGQIITDQFQQIMDVFGKQQEEGQKQQQSWIAQQMAKITKREEVAAARKTPTELRTIARQEALIEMEQMTGITASQLRQMGPLMGQITTYNQEIADIKAQKQASLFANEQRPGRGIELMTAEGNRIAKTYNLEIAALAAQAGVATQQLQLLQGAYAEARATTNQIIEAETYQQRQELADIEWSLDAHQDVYNMETQEAKDAWDRQYRLAQDTLKETQDDWKEKLNLNQRAAEAGVFLGWDSTYMGSRTVEELSSEYAERVATAVKIEKADKRVEDIDVTTGLKKVDSVRFFSEIDAGVNELQQGRNWGEVWDRIKLQFPTVPNSVIDKALGTQWREAGAFEEFQAKKDGGTLSRTEREATVWQWLATEEAGALSDDEKSQQIKSFGLNPETFGIF